MQGVQNQSCLTRSPMAQCHTNKLAKLEGREGFTRVSQLNLETRIVPPNLRQETPGDKRPVLCNSDRLLL